MYRVELISEAVPSGLVAVVTLIGLDAERGEVYFNMPLDLDSANANILHFSSMYGIQRFTRGYITYAISGAFAPLVGNTVFSTLK